MQVSFVFSSLMLSGGVMLAAECATRLTERGHQVAMVTPAGTIAPEIEKLLHGNVRVVEAASGLPDDRSLGSFARLTMALAAAIPPSDVVIATHTPTTVPAYLYTLRHRSTPLSWLYMDYPLMFEDRRSERLVFNRAPKHVDQILTISQPLTDYVEDLTRAPVYTIGAGLSREELFFGCPRVNVGDERRRILYVGDDRPRKGLSQFLSAADITYRIHPDIRLIIVSKQPCHIETQVPYEFYLTPSHEKLSEIYRSSDLFVSSSWGEGLGYPPLEAMACGTPVVLTDSSGVRDYALPGQNCLMAAPGDTDSLAEAIMQFLADEPLAAKLVSNGRATAENYRWHTVIDRLEAALGELVGTQQ